MGFFEKIKNIVSVPEDYDDEYDYKEITEHENADDDFYSTSTGYNAAYDTSRTKTRVDKEFLDPPRVQSERRPAPVPPPPAARRQEKVVNFSNSGGGYQMVLVKPDSFSEATSIADHLMNRSTVVLNLESLSPGTARKLIDFLAGVTYANSGQFKQVAASTYVITPNGVDVRGELSFGDIAELDDLRF